MKINHSKEIFKEDKKISWLNSKKSNGLMIDGIVKNDKLTRILLKYMDIFVACIECKSPNTGIVRNSKNRNWNIKCYNCNSDDKSLINL